MLHEFLSSNREELIRRCGAKVRQRSSPLDPTFKLEHGVPVFIGQLVEALRDEQAPRVPQRARISGASGRKRDSIEGRAALHGKELLRGGYTLDQVVHDYGDICQAITELAKERNAPITVDEFHTFNRLLDDAMAHAVLAFGDDQSDGLPDPRELHARLGKLADEQRRLLDTAVAALVELKMGNAVPLGALGTLLESTLMRLRDHIDKSLPEIRLLSGMTR